MYTLITGCSGFIGYHTTLKLTQQNIKVIGLDNLNNYYDVSLKKKRLNILKNQKQFKFYKLNIENLKTAKQVHSNKVLTINNLGQKTNEIEADALVTNQPNIILGILTADCAPVLAFDPINNIIAAIHIGWKGAIKNILSNTIDTFIGMNSNTTNIKLAIGPCIGPMSYEVKKDCLLYTSDAADE